MGGSDASPLSPVFGSSRETDVFPAFLAEPERRAHAAAKGLLPEVLRLAEKGLGLASSEVAEASVGESAEVLAHRITRQLLVAELRSDLLAPEPVAISQIAGPGLPEQIERVRAVCRELRLEHADQYEALADQVEKELHLDELDVEPEALGRIDTFRFEERRLLQACDTWLAEGEIQRAKATVQDRMTHGSFWASVSRYPERHAAWEACGKLAELALAIDGVAKGLAKPPASSAAWLKAYTADDGWHQLDRTFRDARYRMTKLQGTGDLDRKLREGLHALRRAARADGDRVHQRARRERLAHRRRSPAGGDL